LDGRWCTTSVCGGCIIVCGVMHIYARWPLHKLLEHCTSLRLHCRTKSNSSLCRNQSLRAQSNSMNGNVMLQVKAPSFEGLCFVNVGLLTAQYKMWVLEDYDNNAGEKLGRAIMTRTLSLVALASRLQRLLSSELFLAYSFAWHQSQVEWSHVAHELRNSPNRAVT